VRGGAVILREGTLVGIELVEDEMVRIVVVPVDVEAQATRLVTPRRPRVLSHHFEELVDHVRLDLQ
jgi:hypothetical protein